MFKLDLACGKNKKKGFIGIDIDRKSDADIIATALYLPIKYSYVDEINCSNFLEHLYTEEAQKFFNEIFRVLKESLHGSFRTFQQLDLTKHALFQRVLLPIGIGFLV